MKMLRLKMPASGQVVKLIPHEPLPNSVFQCYRPILMNRAFMPSQIGGVSMKWLYVGVGWIQGQSQRWGSGLISPCRLENKEEIGLNSWTWHTVGVRASTSIVRRICSESVSNKARTVYEPHLNFLEETEKSSGSSHTFPWPLVNFHFFVIGHGRSSEMLNLDLYAKNNRRPPSHSLLRLTLGSNSWSTIKLGNPSFF